VSCNTNSDIATVDFKRIQSALKQTLKFAFIVDWDSPPNNLPTILLNQHIKHKRLFLDEDSRSTCIYIWIKSMHKVTAYIHKHYKAVDNLFIVSTAEDTHM